MSAAASVAPAAAAPPAAPKGASKAPGPATAFDALLAASGLPLVATAAEATGLEPAEGIEAEPNKGEAADDEASDGGLLMGLWMQWMRPVPTPTSSLMPKDGAALAGGSAAPLPEATSTSTSTSTSRKPQAPAALMLLTLPEPLTDAALPTPTGADALGTSLADVQPLATAGALNPASFAVAIDAAAANSMPSVLPLDASMNSLQASAPMPAPAASAPPPAPTVINTQQADWTLQLGERIAGSLDEQQDAIIELHPAELGSLSVRVEMRGNDAQVTIVAASAAARDLLQQSLPQLRELLSIQGLNLTRAQVERSSASQNGNQAQGDSATRERGGGLRSRRQVSSLLLVDAYA